MNVFIKVQLQLHKLHEMTGQTLKNAFRSIVNAFLALYLPNVLTIECGCADKYINDDIIIE